LYATCLRKCRAERPRPDDAIGSVSLGEVMEPADGAAYLGRNPMPVPAPPAFLRGLYISDDAEPAR
jgi:hypothetical protein